MAEEAKTDWETYPVGLKVLAVDDDPLCLKVVEQMLRRCNYEVKTADNGKDALARLREKDAQIDLVLSDVYMPDMDGFRLLETIALELDVPVIMMSSNGETPVVLRGVTHGAVDFLIKPVRIEELRNVWQHVVRRKSHQGHNSREYSGEDEVVDGNRVDKKRKEPQTQIQHEAEENTSAKKPRVVWSVEMHQQFVNAVNSLGIDKAVPKRILDQMNVEGLTRENVASHLQKYRLYLKRVSGVQVQPGTRSKSLRDSGMEMGHFPGMMLPSHAGGSLQHPAEGPNEQEDLKLRLQMRQLQHEQQGLAPHHLKEEVAMPGIMHPMPFKNEAGYESNLNGPAYGAMRQSLTRGSSLANTLPVEEMAASSLVPVSGSGTYDSSHLTYPQQGFGAADMHAITSGDLVYPEPIMQPTPGMHDLHAHPQPYLPQPNSQNFGTGEGLRHGQSEQDMERFIDIFLQPND